MLADQLMYGEVRLLLFDVIIVVKGQLLHDVERLVDRFTQLHQLQVVRRNALRHLLLG